MRTKNERIAVVLVGMLLVLGFVLVGHLGKDIGTAHHTVPVGVHFESMEPVTLPSGQLQPANVVVQYGAGGQ